MGSITNIRTIGPVNTFIGAGSSQIAGKIAHDRGLNKVMIVCDEGVRKFGLADGVIGSLEKAGVEVVIFDRVLPDPPDTIINEAAQMYSENNCQAVIAIGGGSSLDTGKCVAMLQGNNGTIFDCVANPMAPRNMGAPLIAVPTTAGTGSEITNAAVVTVTKTGAKVGIKGPEMYATNALIDPLLTLGLPKSATANTAMDAFAHSVEAMLSGISNPLCDILSLESIRLISKNLESLIADGNNVEARQDIMLAAYLGGMSVNDGACNFGHAVAHTIGAKYHVPHGAVCALAVPMVIEYFANTFPEKIRKIGQAMGVEVADDMTAEEAAKVVADEVRRLNKAVGNKTLKELGIAYEDLPKIAEQVMYDACTYVLKMSCPGKEITPDDFLIPLQKEYQN